MSTLENFFLVLKNQIQRRPRDACSFGDVIHIDAFIAVAQEKALSNIQDSALLLIAHESSIDKFCLIVNNEQIDSFCQMSMGETTCL